MPYMKHFSRKQSLGLLLLLAVGATVTLSLLAWGESVSADGHRSPIQGLTVATGDSPGELSAAWDEPAYQTPAEYRVAWTPDGKKFKKRANTDWNAFPTGTSHTITGLEPGQTYRVKVRARFIIQEAVQRSRWSEVVTGEAAADAPDAPGDLSATPNGQTRIDLSWSPPSGDGGAEVTGYQLQVSVDGTAWSGLSANTGSTTTGYSHTGLEAGSTRHYRTAAINDAGAGPWSAVATGTTEQAQPPSADRPALVALYNATDGANWANNSNWMSNEPIGEWHGVTTNSRDRVTTLNLQRNGLNGQIPQELGSLSKLRSLYLHNNQLSGAIPQELGNLSNLRYLYLTGNQLSGTIPPELGGLFNLIWLYISNNQLSGPIPEELGNLSGLWDLALEHNGLSGQIPPELGNLPNLDLLWLGDNQLSGQIPEELGNLSKLRWLHLDDNQLSGAIPEELGNLSNLGWLHLNDNQLSGQIPVELGGLSSLNFLYLNHNQLSGPIPVELGNLSNLGWLHLDDNQLSGQIPAELGGLSSLERLKLQNNQLSGSIPEELGDLSILRSLYLSGGNEFTGCIPEGLRKARASDLHDLGLPFCDD